MALAKRLAQIFSEPDNVTLCGAKVVGYSSVALFHATMWYDMAANGSTFNMTSYAAAIAALFTSIGAMLKLKPDTPIK
jgi:hypothetical protein